LGLLALILLTVIFILFWNAKTGRQARFFSAWGIMTTLLFILTFLLIRVYVEKFPDITNWYGALGGFVDISLVLYLANSNHLLLLGFD